jgi:LacI family transcriptional regulator
MDQRSSRRITIAEIAAQAGVSIPTVSRVLKGRPDVAPATRARIERLLDESGYIRSNASRTSRKNASGMIDLIVHELENPAIVEIVRGVETGLEGTGLSLALSFTHDDPHEEKRLLDKIYERGTNGVIFVRAQDQPSLRHALRGRGIPFVIYNYSGELAPDIPSVGVTNWAGARMAVEYLLSLGHRRIAMISGPTSLRCSLDRIAGYRTALEDAGIPIDPELIRPGDFRLQSGYTQTCALLALSDPPTAIFAGNDLQAMGVYKALYLRNIHVPERMSVIGFDNIPFAGVVSPGLTTIHQPLFDIGWMATTMLLRLMAGEILDSSRVELATKLITRESCAPPPPYPSPKDQDGWQSRTQ